MYLGPRNFQGNGVISVGPGDILKCCLQKAQVEFSQKKQKQKKLLSTQQRKYMHHETGTNIRKGFALTDSPRGPGIVEVSC